MEGILERIREVMEGWKKRDEKGLRERVRMRARK